MKKKLIITTLISTLLVILATVVFATWQYRLLSLLFFVLINKQWVKAKIKIPYKIIVWGLILCIFIAIPNYFQRGRTQLIYLDKEGERISTPLHIYLINALFPEEELMNFGLKATAVLPSESLSPVFKNLGSRFIRDAQKDFWRGYAIGFYTPYNRLSLQGSNSGTFTIAQAMNEYLGTDYNAIYITKPKNYDSDKTYPVVFFAHGYLGSWELYQGLFSQLDDYMIVSIATRNLSGIFNYNDINKVFTEYIPYLKSEGYQINDVHLMGLSNGGSASNVALRSFSNKFKTITYISTSCDVIKHSKAKVIMIGGGKDASSSRLPSAERGLRSCGTKTAIFFDKDENHYMMVHQQGKIFEFLNNEMK